MKVKNHFLRRRLDAAVQFPFLARLLLDKTFYFYSTFYDYPQERLFTRQRISKLHHRIQSGDAFVNALAEFFKQSHHSIALLKLTKPAHQTEYPVYFHIAYYIQLLDTLRIHAETHGDMDWGRASKALNTVLISPLNRFAVQVNQRLLAELLNKPADYLQLQQANLKFTHIGHALQHITKRLFRIIYRKNYPSHVGLLPKLKRNFLIKLVRSHYSVQHKVARAINTKLLPMSLDEFIALEALLAQKADADTHQQGTSHRWFTPMQGMRQIAGFTLKAVNNDALFKQAQAQFADFTDDFYPLNEPTDCMFVYMVYQQIQCVGVFVLRYCWESKRWFCENLESLQPQEEKALLTVASTVADFISVRFSHELAVWQIMPADFIEFFILSF